MAEEKKEYTMDDLEDIIREYSDKAKQSSDTVRMPPVKPPKKESPVSSDTKPLPDLDGDVRIYPGPKNAPNPSSKRQEPIEFPQNRKVLLRQKMEQGPARRHKELTERGLGQMQARLLLQGLLLLGAAGSAMLYYQVDDSRLKWMVASQLIVLLLSAAVGFHPLYDGVKDALSRRFSPGIMLVLSFIACFTDGLLCLKSLRLPFACVFCLQMLMAQWARLQRMQTQISRLDTLARAENLTAVVKSRKFYQGQSAYHTRPADPEDWTGEGDTSQPEEILRLYCLLVLGLSLVLGIASGVLYGFQRAVQVFAAAILAATPASLFLTVVRPEAILEKRMHKLGIVLGAWKGLRTLERHSFYPLDHRDLFPDGKVKLNGVRFYGDRNPNTVVSFVAALTAADGGCLAEPFEQLRISRNARRVVLKGLTSYPNGIGGRVDEIPVIAGSLEFMGKMGVELPEGAGIPHAVYAAINGSLCAVFAVSFNRSKSAFSGLRTLCQCRWVRPVLLDCDFVLTPEFLHQKLELDLHRMVFPDYLVRMELAEKKPDCSPYPIALTTREGLAQRAYAVTGGAALRSAWNAGVLVHLLGGGLGLLLAGILSLTGANFLLTPYNLLLYSCVWMIPGLLVAEWTRNV